MLEMCENNDVPGADADEENRDWADESRNLKSLETLFLQEGALLRQSPPISTLSG